MPPFKKKVDVNPLTCSCKQARCKNCTYCSQCSCKCSKLKCLCRKGSCSNCRKCSQCSCTCEKENRNNSNETQKQTSKRPLSATSDDNNRKRSARLKAKSVAQTSSTFVSPVPTKSKETKKNGGGEVDSIQIAKYLLEGNNVTIQDAQQLAKAYLRIVDPDVLFSLDDEYEKEKETAEYVAGMKPSDGMSLSTLGDASIFFDTPSSKFPNIGNLATRVNDENINDTFAECFHRMTRLLFNWVEQLASVIYPANHSCFIQDLGFYICKKNKVEYNLERIQDSALDLYYSAKKGSVEKRTIACVIKHVLGVNISRRANRNALEDLQYIWDGKNIIVNKFTRLCKDEEVISKHQHGTTFILELKDYQTRFFRRSYPPCIYLHLTSATYI